MSLAAWLRARAAEVLPAGAAADAVQATLERHGFGEDLSGAQALQALRTLWPRLAQELPPEVAEAWLERAARDLHAGALPAGSLPAPPPSPHTAAEDLLLRFAVIRAEAARGASARLDHDPAVPEEARLLARHTAEVAGAEAGRLRAERELRRLRAEHALAELAAEYHLALLRRDALHAALPRLPQLAAELAEVEAVVAQLAKLGLAPHLPACRRLPDLGAPARSGQAELVRHPQALLARQEVQRAELIQARRPGPAARAGLEEAGAAYREVLAALAAETRARLDVLQRHAAAHAELETLAQAHAEALAAAEGRGDLAPAAQARFQLAQLRAVQQVEAHRLLEGLALLPGSGEAAEAPN